MKEYTLFLVKQLKVTKRQNILKEVPSFGYYELYYRRFIRGIIYQYKIG